MSIADQERDWVIVGAGGHGRVTLDALRAMGGAGRVALTDPALDAGQAAAWGVDVVARDEDLPRLAEDGFTRFIVGVGHGGRIGLRQRLFALAQAAGLSPAAVVHRQAIVAPSATVGDGTLVAAGAVLNPAASIGANAIINTRAVVEHDARVDDDAHVAPGAVILGGARVGAGAFIGAGAIVLPGVSLGDGVLVAAGVVVDCDQPAGTRLRRSGPSTMAR